MSYLSIQKQIDLISAYEDYRKIPADQQITEYFGDYGLHVEKSGITKAVFEDIYQNALRSIGMDEASFMQNDSMNSHGTILKQFQNHTSHLDVFLTNMGAYAAGEPKGEWLHLPTARETLQGTLDRIGLSTGGEYFITDYTCSAFPQLTEYLGEHENLNELNYLAAQLQEVSQSDMLTDEFSAALELGKDAGSVKDLINLTEPDNLNSYTMLTQVCDDYELGLQIIEMNEYDLDAMGDLAQYIDYEALGRDTRINEGGIFTDRGYFAPNRDGLYEFYKSSEDIPQEYLITTDMTEAAAEAMAEDVSVGMTMV